MQVSASGVFQLQVGPWTNERRVAADGRCCDAAGAQQQADGDAACPGRCRTFVRVCLSHYQTEIPARPDCTYGSVVTAADQFNDDLLQPRCNVDIPFDFAWPV